MSRILDFMIRLLNAIDKTNRNFGLFHRNDSILIALSGGPDSVALLHLLNLIAPEYNLAIAAAHVNHQLRNEAEVDRRFCRELCRIYGIKFHSRSIDIRKKAARLKIGIEQAGREYRYSFFQLLCKKYGYAKIATGHTADDNAETFLLNLIRGADLAGLGAILPRRGNIIRPLIEVTKKELLTFLNDNGLSYRVDKSNLGLEYNRNLVRHKILPLLEAINPAASWHIARAAGSFQESHKFIQAEADKAFKNCLVERSKKQIILDLAKLPLYYKSLESWVLLKAYFELSGAITRPSSAKIGRTLALKRGGSVAFLDNGIVAAKHKGKLILSQPFRPFKRTILKKNKINALSGTDFKVKVDVLRIYSLAEIVNSNDESVAYLDNDKVSNLAIRAFKNGDRFKPLGMKGTKKLADYLNDKAVLSVAKRFIPLVVVDDKIAWVAGYGISDEFKVTDKTEEVLKLQLISG
jgi:tRNA(Ile)-lysidine synthase